MLNLRKGALNAMRQLQRIGAHVNAHEQKDLFLLRKFDPGGCQSISTADCSKLK